MKSHLTKRLSLVSGVILCAVISSCDTDKNLFDPEKTRKLYEETFPVQNINPDMDWKMTQNTQVNIVVNEDRGTDYKVQIFDANPLNASSNAKLVAEGYANQDMTFQTVTDFPKALTTAFVARIDKNGRYLVQPVTVENGTITATFGSATSRIGKAMTRADESAVPTCDAPYTNIQIEALLAEATEVQTNWDLTANSSQGGAYSNYDVFKQTDRVFKITSDGRKYFYANMSGKNIRLIIASNNVQIPESYSNSLEIIVAPGAVLNLGNGTYSLPNDCRLIVMAGGRVTGAGATITFNNHSEGKINYNGGSIDIKQITFSAGEGKCYYNYGTLKLQTFSSTNNNVFVNRGTATIATYNGANSQVKSACYLEVANNLSCKELVIGSNSAVKCGSFTHDGRSGVTVLLEKNTLLNCLGTANLSRKITGPTDGYALFKMNSITGNRYDSSSTSYIKNNVICEVTDQTTHIQNPGWSVNKVDSWSMFDWLVYRLLQNGATYCNPEKANFTLPADDCTGDGYISDKEEDPVVTEDMAYTYAYEDNFPYPGDYDFNDIVLDVTPKYTRDNSNRIQKIAYDVKLRAIGGIKMHGAALRLIGVQKSEISSIEFSDPDGLRSTLGNALFENVSLEAGDPHLVIPLFGDAHKAVGYSTTSRPMLNTNHNAQSFTPVTLTVTLTLADQTKTEPLLTNSNLDFFIGYPGTLAGRTEVHLYEFRSYGATAKGTVYDQNMAVAGKITWAVCVPDFKYPVEAKVITSAYPLFENWATTGGLNPEYADWYKHPAEQPNMIY